MLTIITVVQDYEHPAWEHYVQGYRDKAEVTRNKKWSQIAHQPGRAKHLVPGLYLEHETVGPYTTVRKWQTHELLYMPSTGPIPKRWQPNRDTICTIIAQ